ncbi:MAG: DEAD/DEAH box helicase [Gemmatimonadetes bacterium]|nr:DEAD/DEAH box helicase [Gemmatimonadota bacterium]MYG83696.1 DEAD/DEAH box helicase [Gemmatimonadota bacterium]MYJ91069.1 DEAD/DEAH box helicase [Gemmatimonadota bacterium]
MPKLMSHQIEGREFLVRQRCGILAFEQGLGKTLTAIEAFLKLRHQNRAEHMLVLCPNSLKRTWSREIREFAPTLTVRIIEGSARTRRALLANVFEDVVIINYEAARGEIAPIRALMRRLHPVLVLDESHYVKSRYSLTSVSARYLAPLADFRWLLTGTPVTNSPSDIHTQIGLVTNDNILGPYDVFMIDYGDATENPILQEKLASRISTYLLRRTKEECLDLPAKTFVDIYVPLPPWQRELYCDTRDGIVRDVSSMDGEEFQAFASTAFTRLLRLSQIASNPALVNPEEKREPAKFEELDRMLHELIGSCGRKVILWSYYVRTIEDLVERYQHYGVVSLYGGTPTDERQDIVQSFQSDGKVNLLIANPAAAGTGFTMTAATYAIYETLNWRYDLYAQSQDRNHRIGQELGVTYLRLIAEDTLDEVVVQALERKAEMARRIVGDPNKGVSFANMTPLQFCEMLMSNRLPD